MSLEAQSSPIPSLADAVEIVLAGSAPPAEAGDFREMLDRFITPTTRFVSLSMGDVSFLSGEALGHLGALSEALRSRSGQIVLVGVPPKIKAVIDNLGMRDLFHFESSPEEARTHLVGRVSRLAPGRIVVLDGPLKGRTFEIGVSPLEIGRDMKAVIPVRHPLVEMRHAEIYQQGSECRIRDLSTRSGTFVGDRRIQDDALRANDVIRVGNVKMAYHPPGEK